jgi:RNA polymerase sigma-70 factor (ECF subfamily)
MTHTPHLQPFAQQTSQILQMPPHATAEDPTDDALGAAVLRGDEDAFRTLYRRHTPRLRRLVARLVGDVNAESDDAVQEAWMRAVRGLGEFRKDASFSTWISAIAIRVCHETFRRQKRWSFVGGELPDTLATRPGMVHERLDLEAAMARLPEGYRAVLVLHDVEGLTHGDIAERLGIAEGTSKSTLSRARAAVRLHLGSPD